MPFGPDRPVKSTGSTMQIGSWTLLCDIAGQVSKEPDNPIVTVASVGIAREAVSHVRRRLLRAFNGAPVKWKHGKLDGFARAANLIVSYHLPVVVWHLHRGDIKQWSRFFEQAMAFGQEAEGRVGRRPPYVTGNTTMRMHMLARGFAKLTRRILDERPIWGTRALTLQLELIADSDLPAGESTELFCGWLEEWAQHTRLISERNIQPEVRARCSTEQAEPLLLLPYYLAGLSHHADPRTRLASPVVSSEDASQALDDLRKRHGSKLFEPAEDFREPYPLAYERGRVVRRRSPATSYFPVRIGPRATRV